MKRYRGLCDSCTETMTYLGLIRAMQPQRCLVHPGPALSDFVAEEVKGGENEIAVCFNT